MIKLTATGPYTAKDQRKANLATKFIGRGAPGSSTAQYARDFGHLANCGQYVETDVVFISTNGNRPNRITPDWDEIWKAVRAHCTIVIDAPHDRMRQYNIGEREVAAALHNSNYTEPNSDGIFVSTYKA